MTKTFETLYHKGKSGAVYSWEVLCDEGIVTTIYGQVKGKKTITHKLVEQKNIGKSNETALEEQAIKEAQSMWQNKLDRKYSLTPEEAHEDVLLPMLAKDFDKFKKKLTYPVYVQPKLDGVRAMARWDGDHVVLTSRNGKPWLSCPHITDELENILPQGSVFDGELYIHGKNFQEISRLVKKLGSEYKSVSYNVYDMPEFEGDSDLSFKDRSDHMSEVLNYDWFHVINVETKIANSEEEVALYHSECVARGYEGAMVRSMEGKYLYLYRSNDLLKVKAFDDGEYQVVGFSQGKGRYADAVIWQCITKDGSSFNVNMKAKLSEKQEMLENNINYLGKFLTVKYFGLSEDGIPRFPIGLHFRPEEDLPNG